MNSLLLRSREIQFDHWLLPAFELRRREAVCIHFPREPLAEFSRIKAELVEILIGRRSGCTLFGDIVHANPAQPRRAIFGFFRRDRVSKYLARKGIAKNTTLDILKRVGLQHDPYLDTYAGNTRLILGLEAAWAKRPAAILFSTSTADGMGSQRAFQAVHDHLPECAAIHLSPMFTNGERDCLPGARCLSVLPIPSLLKQPA